jgi:DNA topoisomerase-1
MLPVRSPIALKKPAFSALLRNSTLAARVAHIRQVAPGELGLARKRVGGRFHYLASSGRRVTNARQLARIASLAIPPAWQKVWICATADGHVQATGEDARGRKQYRYHPAWRSVRDGAKYAEVVAFGNALPRLREQLACDLAQRSLCRPKVVAAVISIMQLTSIRVGNDAYASSNGSYGLTTLLNRHVRIQGSRLSLNFRGKGGKTQLIQVRDRKLAGIARQCRELPGSRLFQYRAADGKPRGVTASDVNRYLRDATGAPFTAKEFRTWHGTLHAAWHLANCEPGTSKASAKRAIKAAVEVASAHLGNTAAICRKSYVHPAVLEAFLDGGLKRELGSYLSRAKRSAPDGLTPEEWAVLAWLERRTSQALEKCA